MREFARRNVLLLLLAVLGLAGVAGALLLREHSFPVATVSFRVLGPQAETLARVYLGERGFDLAGYSCAVAFTVDDAAKNYIHKEAGLSTLNRLAAGDVAVWRWRVRFFRELEQEEFNVEIATDGRTTGFWRVLPEDAPGADPTLDEAQAAAEAFLASGGRDLADYRLVSASTARRRARSDHFFTWENKDFKLGEVTYRVDVWLQGDRVAGFREYLKIPETWLRQSAQETNRGSVLALVGWALTYALALAMAVVCLLRLRAGGVRWRFALALALALGAVGVATGVNSLPLLMIDYPTTSTLGAYIWARLQAQAASLIPTALAVVLAGVAGDWLYAAVLRARLPLSTIASRQGIVSGEFAKGVLAGYAVAGIGLGYVTAFYAATGKLFGTWWPAEVPYRDLMSTFLPGLYPLTVGFGAAISEELLFRLFAVPFFLWLGIAAVRGRPAFLAHPHLRRIAEAAVVVVAIVAPALIWGTLHATYPQQPFYIRTLELGISGSVWALVMLRYGIVATITSHYVYNASVIGGLFFLSGSPYLSASAVVVIVLPLLLLAPALVRRLRGKESPADGLPAKPPAPPPQALRVPSLAKSTGVPCVAGRRRLLALALAGVLALVLASVWHVPRLGEAARLTLGPAEAQAKAGEYARGLGIAPEAWRSVTSFGDWSLGNQTAYLLRRLGTAETNRFLAEQLPSYVWQTRYFRPLERAEVFVRLDQNGALHSFERRLPEDAPGERLTQAEALALAERFVREQGRGEALAWELVTAVAEERKARTDHVFEWENTAGRLDEAAFRLRVGVKGGEIGEFSTYLKLPEAFERRMMKQSEADVALGLARDALSAAVLVVAVVVFVLRFRRDDIDLRFAAGAAGALLALAVLRQLNALPTLLAGYWTTVELEGYLVWRIVNIMQSLVGDAAWHFVLFGVAESLFRERFPDYAGPAGQLRAVWQSQRTALATGLFALAAAPVLWLCLASYRAAREQFASQHLVAEATVPAWLLDAAWPALGLAWDNASFAIWLALGASGITLWLWRWLRRPWAVALVWALALTILYAGRLEESQLLVVEAARWAAMVALVYLIVARFVGANLMAYGLAAYTFLAARDALFLLSQPYQPYAAHGAVALALAFAPALLLVARGLIGKTEAKMETRGDDR